MHQSRLKNMPFLSLRYSTVNIKSLKGTVYKALVKNLTPFFSREKGFFPSRHKRLTKKI